jgi:hypothetical protein
LAQKPGQAEQQVYCLGDFERLIKLWIGTCDPCEEKTHHYVSLFYHFFLQQGSNNLIFVCLKIRDLPHLFSLLVFPWTSTTMAPPVKHGLLENSPRFHDVPGNLYL